MSQQIYSRVAGSIFHAERNSVFVTVKQDFEIYNINPESYLLYATIFTGKLRIRSQLA